MSLGPGVTAEMGPAAVIKPQRQGGNAVARSHRLRCPAGPDVNRTGRTLRGPLDWSPPSHPVLFPAWARRR